MNENRQANAYKRAIEILEQLDRAYMNIGRGQVSAEIAELIADLEARVERLERDKPITWAVGRVGH